jgi:hypothetical protein
VLIVEPCICPAIDGQNIGRDRGGVGQRHDKLAKVFGVIALSACE